MALQQSLYTLPGNGQKQTNKRIRTLLLMNTSFSKNKLARLAGLIYLGVVLTGIFSLLYVPGKLIVPGNTTTTYQNITASETVFRVWILSGLLCYIFFLFLPLVLYKLLKQVNENYAAVMVLLAIMSVPVYFLNVKTNLIFFLLSTTLTAPAFQPNKLNRRFRYT